MAKENSKKPKEKDLNYKFFLVNVKIRYIDSIDDISPQEYSEIFREFYNKGVTGKSSKQKECVLITLVEQEIPDKEPVFWGQIVEVTNINNKRWFDKINKAIDNTFTIPNKYAANAHVTEYVFIPAVHRFCYQFKSSDYLNPYAVKNYLQSALEKLLEGRYVVQIDVETDNSTIERILEAPELERIWIKINYSNNDFSKEMKAFIENDLRVSNIGEMEITAVKKDNNSIDISQSGILVGALQTAISNGEAEATIRDSSGKKLKIKTENSPNRLNVITTIEKRIVNLYKLVINEFRNPQL